MDAVIYARISADAQGRGLGVARQVEDCEAKATAMGWTVSETYTDNDVSASKNVPRPEYTRLLQNIENGTVRAVVVYDLDRLTRKPAELETFIDLTDRFGIALANVSGDVDLTTANGRMLARIKGAVARQEADRISERTTRQKRQLAESGKPLGTRFRVFGYTRDWELEPNEAPVVKEIFERASAGESQNSITKDLANRGTQTVSGKPWKHVNTSRVLKYHAYAGINVFKGQVIGKTAFPSIVDETLFEAVQSHTAPHGITRRYLLSGFLICDKCKSTMVGTSTKGNARYRCDHRSGGCGKSSIRMDWVDGPVSQRVLSFYNTDEYLTGDKVQPRDYEGEIAQIDERIESLQSAYDSGDLDLSDLVPLLKAERAKRRDVLSEATEDTTAVLRLLGGYDEWDSADLSVQRAIVGRYVRHIVIKSAGKGRQKGQGRHRISVHWTDGTVSGLPEGTVVERVVT